MQQGKRMRKRKKREIFFFVLTCNIQMAWPDEISRIRLIEGDFNVVRD